MILNDEKRSILYEEMGQFRVGFGEIESRVKRRRMRRRGLISVGTFLAGLAVLGIGIVTNSQSKLDTVQFTSFNTPGPPHLLNNEISFGYLPAGFTLASDQQDNRVSNPASYQRTIVYKGGTQSSPQQITLSIEQAKSVNLPSKLLASNSSEKDSFSSVNGHKALVVTFFDHVSGTVTYSYSGGQKHQIITCEGPVNTPRDQISPICRGALNSSGSRVGPSMPNIAAPNNIYPAISLQWIVRPTVKFNLIGRGVTEATLERIAENISYNPSVGNCISGNRQLSGKWCAPGIVGSPAVDSPLIPPGGIELASGITAGHSWAISADLQKGNVWVDLGYSGQFSLGGKWFGSTGAETTVEMSTADNGQSFLYGMVPQYVTKVTATVAGGHTFKINVLPAKIGGWGFFILPLGKTSSPAHLSLYSQNRVVYRGKWNSNTTFSGIPLQ